MANNKKRNSSISYEILINNSNARKANQPDHTPSDPAFVPQGMPAKHGPGSKSIGKIKGSGKGSDKLLRTPSSPQYTKQESRPAQYLYPHSKI